MISKTALCCILSMMTFLLSGCEYRPRPKLETRLEIKNPAKAHTFKFYIDPKGLTTHYYSRIHGELDGNAEIRRYADCGGYKNCDPLIGSLYSIHELPKGKVYVGDSSEYLGGTVIIRYKPKGATKGRLFIDIRVP